jgi:hypothetical protein
MFFLFTFYSSSKIKNNNKHTNRSLIFNPFKNGPMLRPLIPLNFLSLFSLAHHHFHTRVVLILDFLKHPVLSQMFHVPFVQFENVSDAIQASSRFEQICVFA